MLESEHPEVKVNACGASAVDPGTCLTGLMIVAEYNPTVSLLIHKIRC